MAKKCEGCSGTMTKEHTVECKSGCSFTVCHNCHSTPQAKIGTKCPKCDKIASWKKK